MRVSASGQGRRAAARLWMCCMGVKQLSRAGNWVVVVAACLQPSPPPPLPLRQRMGRQGEGIWLYVGYRGCSAPGRRGWRSSCLSPQLICRAISVMDVVQ